MKKKLTTIALTFGLALGSTVALAPAASAEPSPGMARAYAHCHVWDFWPYIYCHTAVT